MTVRIKASPDADNLIRIVCDGTEIEIEVTPRDTGPVFGPFNPTEPFDPAGDFIPMWITASKIAPFLDAGGIGRGQVSVASMNIPTWATVDTGKLATRMAAGQQLDMLRVVTPDIDVHQVGELARRLEHDPAVTAPTLLIDIAPREGFAG